MFRDFLERNWILKAQVTISEPQLESIYFVATSKFCINLEEYDVYFTAKKRHKRVLGIRLLSFIRLLWAVWSLKKYEHLKSVTKDNYNALCLVNLNIPRMKSYFIICQCELNFCHSKNAFSIYSLYIQVSIFVQVWFNDKKRKPILGFVYVKHVFKLSTSKCGGMYKINY